MRPAGNKILEFRTIDGSRVAVLAESIDEIMPISGGHARLRLRSGSTHDLAEEYDQVVQQWRKAFAPRRVHQGRAGA